MKSKLRWSAAMLLAGTFSFTALLSSCGGGGGELADPLAEFRNQKLDWQPCDPTFAGSEFTVQMEKLGGRARCALMRAPLDYANPARGELVVAVLRVSAENAQQRRGAILFNPGGPGGDGLILAPLFGSLWYEAKADDPESVSALYKEMSRRYDLVGFSPRGTGGSTRLYCGSDEKQHFVADFAFDRSPANIDALLFNARLAADACKKNPLTPFINTDATARDMDLIRHLLGDEKINYYGLSYGTALGLWYASLFPDRVDRMLLSGIVDATRGLEETFQAMAPARQRVLDTVLAPYAAAHPSRFGLGNSADAIRTVHRSLPAELQYVASDAMRSKLRNSGNADTTVLMLRAAQVLADLLKAHSGADEATIKALIAKVCFVAPTANGGCAEPRPKQDAEARDLAYTLNAEYFARVRRETQPVDLPAEPAMNFTVICNDMAMRQSQSEWIVAESRHAALYPFGAGEFTSWPCLFWGPPAVTKPPLEPATRIAGLLMVQTSMDAVTSREVAMQTFAVMPNASLIEIAGEYAHGTFVPYGRDCIDRPVAEYFLFNRQPPRTASAACPGLPLAADREAAIGTKAARAATDSASMFNDSAAAAAAYAGIHRLLDRNR